MTCKPGFRREGERLEKRVRLEQREREISREGGIRREGEIRRKREITREGESLAGRVFKKGPSPPSPRPKGPAQPQAQRTRHTDLRLDLLYCIANDLFCCTLLCTQEISCVNTRDPVYIWEILARARPVHNVTQKTINPPPQQNKNI